MRIIDKIEINYFRSIYSATVSNANDANIFVGNNDAGKSNILKALNLFFNGEPDLDSDFEFISDLSRLRETEARAAKGRATIWIRITFNNFVGWTSLPEKFTVKRTWNRYEYAASDTYTKGINPVMVAKFLNKISYHYVPAVRGRDTFSHYLGLLHDALIEDEKAGVRESSENLMRSINKSTTDMSERIKRQLKFRSIIEVPEDLRDLFEAFDFSTSYGGYNIPLQRRGDGIQARHIPFILDFIARHSKKHHIWGYEEPENSVELGRSFEMADQFENEFADENQIFLTTHSPAFYDMQGANVARWLVQSENTGPNDEVVSTITPISDSAEPDERLGIAPLIAKRARNLHQQNTALQDNIEALTAIVAEAERLQVVVEGETDKLIIERAIALAGDGLSERLGLVSADGAGNVGAFINVFSRVPIASHGAVAGLVDDDSAGRKEGKKFEHHHFFGETGFRLVSRGKKVLWGTLAPPKNVQALRDDIRRKRVGEADLPVPIEFMFPPTVIGAALANGTLELEDRWTVARDNELDLRVNLSEQYGAFLPDECAYLARKIRKECKMRFAEWACRLDLDAFIAFQPLIAGLNEIADWADAQSH